MKVELKRDYFRENNKIYEILKIVGEKIYLKAPKNQYKWVTKECIKCYIEN